MKRILVLTDFSDGAKNAAEAAVKIAGKINANIILLNTYAVSSFAASTESMPWPLEYYKVLEEESAQGLKDEQKRLLEIVEEQKNHVGTVELQILSLGGLLGDLISDVLKDQDIALVMMGGRQNKGAEFLFGSDIHTVIDKAKRPVFIISDKPLNYPITNVVFATDLSLTDQKALNYVAGLSELLEFHIHVCHVRTEHPPTQKKDFFNSVYEFEERIEESKLSKMNFVELNGDNVKEELQKFTSSISCDLLVLSDRKHSFFGRLINDTPATDLIKIHKHPMLILPAES